MSPFNDAYISSFSLFLFLPQLTVVLAFVLITPVEQFFPLTTEMPTRKDFSVLC